MTLQERILNINRHLEFETDAQRREKLRALREQLVTTKLNREITDENKAQKLSELWDLANLMERKGHTDIANKFREIHGKHRGAK